MPRKTADICAYRTLLFKDCTIEAIFKDREAGKQKRLKKEDEAKFRRLARFYFESKPIAENREDGKRIGIDAVSAYTKEELINQIMNTIWGMQCFGDEVELLVYPNIGSINEKAELDILENYHRGKFVVGNMVTGTFEGDEEGGILHADKFTSSMNDAAIVRGIVNELGLKNGDVIKARTYYDKNLHFNCVHYIDTINGIDIENEKFRENLAALRDTEKIATTDRFFFSENGGSKFAVCLDAFAPINFGQAELIVASGKMNFSEYAARIAAIVDAMENVDEVLLCVPGENIETAEKARSIYPGVVVVDETVSDKADSVMKRMCDYATRRAECGVNVVVIAGNLDDVAKDAEEAKAIVRTAGRYDRRGSVSVIAFVDYDNKNGRYYDVRRAASAELRIVSRPFYGDYVIDAENCYSSTAEKFTGAEKKARDMLKKLARVSGAEQATSEVAEYDNYEKFVGGMSLGMKSSRFS